MSDAPVQQSVQPSMTASTGLERVMRQVLDMKGAGDIDNLIREVWDVLEALAYDFASCAFLLIDNERDWLSSYSVWSQHDVASIFSDDEALRHVQRLGEEAGGLPRLIIFTGETCLDDAPSIYQEAIAAWHTGQVERHVLSLAEIEEMARVNTHRYGAPMTAESYPVGSHLYVPFEHGVFTLRTDRQQVDPFSDVQVDFLERLVRIISVGYTRYREFLRLERDRTVQRMRAEVQAMRQGDDIIDLMGLLWDELHRVGIDFYYMSISVSDDEDDDVQLYGVWDRRFSDKLTSTYPLHRADVTSTADLYFQQIPRSRWNEYHTEFSGVYRVAKEDVATYAERTSRMWQADGVAVDSPASPFAGRAFVMMAAHLPQGRIMVAQIQETAESPPPNFTPEHLEILEAFADALGLGFARYFDFQRLERHNRELEVERSVDQLRAEVASMRQSSDIAGVTVLLGRLLQELGLEYWTCSFSVIDADAALMHLYAVGPTERIRSMPVGTIVASELDVIIDRLGVVGAPMFVPDIVEGFDFAYMAEDLQGSPVLEDRDLPPRVVHRNEAQALEELPRYQQHWTNIWTLDMLPRSVIRVPFSHGSIAVMHMAADQFCQPDVDLVAAFADAISLGFTRFHDFQRLERHNRELVLRQSVDRLRAEVASMRHSSDIADVAVLLAEQLKALGLDFSTSSFSVIDEEDELVRLYGLGPGEWVYENITLGEHAVLDRSMIGVLAEMGGPVSIRDIIPGFHFFYNEEALQDSPIFAERDQPPRLLHRSEEDVQEQLVLYRKRWSPEYPQDRIPRSVIRVPFSHGTIALVHFDSDQFTQRDVDLVAAYADAMSLGFTRFHDFQRLEQRNRELEIERALEQVQIGVQNMKTSGDIMPVITLLSHELKRLGLDYSWCTISIVDREAEKVRV